MFPCSESAFKELVEMAHPRTCYFTQDCAAQGHELKSLPGLRDTLQSPMMALVASYYVFVPKRASQACGSCGV